MVQDFTGTREGRNFGSPSTPEVEIEEQAQPKPAYQLPADKEANVVLAASAKDKALPEGLTNIGRHGVVIPDPQAQLRGFYTEHAGLLVAQFPSVQVRSKEG
jgi:hypothetical protein